MILETSSWAFRRHFDLMRNISIIVVLGIFLAGCVRTEGTLKIRGKVIDEFTKAQIPGREIFVQGLPERNNKIVPADAGHFSTDSTGCFIYSLEKVKDARYYNFYVVGDSDYASRTEKISLLLLKRNAKYLSFSLAKLADLTINIQKATNIPYRDTLYLSWESDKVDFRALYPYKIDNYGITDNSVGLMPGFGLRWIGGTFNSTVRTKVIADKITIIHWELIRKKSSKKITDTIKCQRDLSHIVNFKY